MASATDVEETAREFATRFADGSFADAAALLSGDGREAVVDSFPEAFREESMDAEDALEGYWRGLYSQYGECEGVGAVDGDGEATVEFAFETGTETATVEVDGDAVTDFSFAPGYEVPGYVDESAFDERGVTVDAGDVALDALLAMPDGDGPFPGVVLVHGAGVHDPDGTAGASQILKDLAWGLASEGVATLRYEKRLASHDVDDAEFTLDRVVTDDAVAAVETLAGADEVDEGRVFVAGHSQGGMAAPRIAERHAGCAGVVVLDGRADAVLHPEDADVIRYEFEPDGDLDEEQADQLEQDRETLRRIVAGDFDDDETLMGRPGVWHRSLLRYDPSATASGLDVPSFVLKAGRADEETQPGLAAWFREEFEKWRAADLPEGSRVALYDGLDHYFQAGFAPAHPVSLHFGGNVAASVVADVAAWIHGVASR